MRDPWEWTEEDILSLIHNKVGESTRLEYKACDALGKTDGIKKEISRDVSAFANSAGGTIIYGVIENSAHEPEKMDAGFDPSGDISGEWLEQVINSTIERRISGVVINPVILNKTNPGKVIYVVYIPESNLAPHMASDDRFYRRFNFQRVAMKEYEVRNLMRQEHYPSREIVCAWRDHAINPLLSLLGNEKAYLEQRRWEWDRTGRRGLGPNISYISDSKTHSANQEQFLESYPKIREAMETHDEAARAVSVCCDLLFKTIKESERLFDVYQQAVSSQSLQELRAKHPYDLQHAESDEELMRKLFNSPENREGHLATFAADIMNKLGEISPHHRTSAPLWNTYREQFLEVLHCWPVSERRAQADAAREDLLGRVETLITLLKRERSELAKQHGIPVEAIKDVQVIYGGGHGFF